MRLASSHPVSKDRPPLTRRPRELVVIGLAFLLLAALIAAIPYLPR